MGSHVSGKATNHRSGLKSEIRAMAFLSPAAFTLTESVHRRKSDHFGGCDRIGRRSQVGTQQERVGERPREDLAGQEALQEPDLTDGSKGDGKQRTTHGTLGIVFGVSTDLNFARSLRDHESGIFGFTEVFRPYRLRGGRRSPLCTFP